MVGEGYSQEAHKSCSKEGRDCNINPCILHEGEAYNIPKEGQYRHVAEGCPRGISHGCKAKSSDSGEEAFLQYQ